MPLVLSKEMFQVLLFVRIFIYLIQVKMQNERGLPSMDLPTVTEFTREFEKLFYEGDYQAMSSYYVEDSELIGMGHPVYKGKEQVTDFWKRTVFATRKIKISRNIEVTRIWADSNTAYVCGTVCVRYYLVFVPVRKMFRYLTAWRKTGYGWQLAVDISTGVKS